MSKRFECRHVVPGCEGVVEGDSDEAVLAAVADHAASAHGLDVLPDALVDRVREGITEG